MSKIVLTTGLLFASLTGLAGAMPPHASTAPVKAAVVDDDIGFASGPFTTKQKAETEKLNLEAIGWQVSDPRQEDDGWWVYYGAPKKPKNTPR